MWTFLDAQTENAVTRLTSLASPSFLPVYPNRFLSPSGRMLFFASRRGSPLSPYTLDLRTGLASQVFQTAVDLQPDSLSLSLDAKRLFWIEAGKLISLVLGSRHAQAVASQVNDFCLAPSGDILLLKGTSLEWLSRPGQTVLGNVQSPLILKQNASALAFFESAQLWFASLPSQSGEQTASARLLVSPETVGRPCWSPDTDAMLFLRRAGASGVDLVEANLDPKGTHPGAELHRISATSRFSAFAPNADGSVFAGASSSRAQPSIILLVRSLGRELVLCEHHATRPEATHPAFSPDSRRLFFASDFQGTPAIYAINTERLVEPTEAPPSGL